MAGKKLIKHSLFRVVYRIEKPEECEGTWSGNGRRMSVVAHTVEEAIERVKQHESGCSTITFGEVVRETIEVWA